MHFSNWNTVKPRNNKQINKKRFSFFHFTVLHYFLPPKQDTLPLRPLFSSSNGDLNVWVFAVFIYLFFYLYIYLIRIYEIVICTRKCLIFSFQVSVLLGEFSVGNLESVAFLFKGSLVSAESLVLSLQVSDLFGESGVVVLQLSVSLGEVLNNDLSLKSLQYTG